MKVCISEKHTLMASGVEITLYLENTSNNSGPGIVFKNYQELEYIHFNPRFDTIYSIKYVNLLKLVCPHWIKE